MIARLLHCKEAGNQVGTQATLIAILKERRKSEWLAGTPASLKTGI
jgi:hypothetical protein